MNICTIEYDDLPQKLREIHEAPEQLYCWGNVELLHRDAIGIVGTRAASPYGLSQSFRFAKELSQQGLCIVSGLAFGIDAQAHKGALEGDGSTIAVIAQGLKNLQPKRHQNLAKKIVEKGGLIISERGDSEPSFKSDYLVRNRLIAGLSRGTLVIEAAERSGALNTAKHALVQNRDVMALPGRATDPRSKGTNLLIQRGAQLVLGPKDVLEWIGLEWQGQSAPIHERHLALYSLLSESPQSSAQLIERLPEQMECIAKYLLEMELDGLIKQMPDGRYAICGGS